MSPRNKRLLQCLVDKERVFVRDLRSLIGALNPAQNALSLRKSGWNIQTDYIAVRDRDGKVCRPGYYWMETSERERAYEFLKVAERAGGAAPSACDDLKCDDSQSSVSDNSKGGKNDKEFIQYQSRRRWDIFKVSISGEF